MTAPAEQTASLLPATRNALALLLLAMADDEFVIGFTDSEWTGIAPLLEEDVAMSSISQDELGHARALYELLAEVVNDGRDADTIAYDRPPAGFYHARLLDHGRGDWAETIARRFLYDTADAVRLEAIAGSSFQPLAALAGKLRREERYHVLHANAWLERLAGPHGEPRRRLIEAFEALGPDAATVLAPLPDDLALVMSGIVTAGAAEVDARWRASIGPTLERLGLPAIPALADGDRARSGHGEPFARLHADFTAVRRLDPEATW